MQRLPVRRISSDLIRLLWIVSVLAWTLPASAQSVFVESFDGGSNEGGWTWGPPPVIESNGGNPGAYLHVPFLDTFAPQPRTTVAPSAFTGDYRGHGVIAVGIDLITFSVDFSADGRPLTVMLVSDNDTPGDFNDDWAAYSIGPANVPLTGQGWRSYDFPIPSEELTLPPGWLTLPLGGSSPPNPDWNDVITDVDRLQFFYGDPELFFIFQGWDLGLDNPRITTQSLDPGRVPPTVRLDRLAPGLRISWSDSECAGATDYGIYVGTIGSWYDHLRITCTDIGQDRTETLPDLEGDRYFLVVPRNDDGEGSYGLSYDRATDTSAERPTAGPASCAASQLLGCP